MKVEFEREARTEFRDIACWPLKMWMLPPNLSLLLPLFTLFAVGLVPAPSLGADISGQFVTEDNPPRPAKNVLLELWPESTSAKSRLATVLTDTDGRFSFTDIAPGPYRIKVADFNKAFDPYGPLDTFYFPRNGELVELPAADASAKVRLLARLAAIVDGRVADESGKHLDVLIGSRSSNSTIVREDETGRFRVPSIEPGKDAEILLTPIDKRYQYTHIVQLKASELKPGKRINLGEIRWQPLPETPNLSGIVHNPDGALASGMLSFEMWSLEQPVLATMYAKDGRFETRIPPGKYRIVKLKLSHVSSKELATVTVPPNGVVSIEFTFDPKANDSTPATRPVSSR